LAECSEDSLAERRHLFPCNVVEQGDIYCNFPSVFSLFAFVFVLFFPACRRCCVLFEFGLARAQMQLIECENCSGLPQEFPV